MSNQEKSPFSFRRVTGVLTTLALLASCARAAHASSSHGEIEQGGTAVSTQAVGTLTPLEEYRETVLKDNAERVRRFTEAARQNGSPDFSGQGYESCTVDSECLSGVQSCEAGIIPSSEQLPGYCVPIDSVGN